MAGSHSLLWRVCLVCLICAIGVVCGDSLLKGQNPQANEVKLEPIPPELLRAQIKRIAIWPRPEDVENTEGLMTAISRYLADKAGWFVSPPELAQEIANRAKAPTSSLDAIDPNTGDVDLQRYMQPQRSLVVTLAEETRSDAVLEVKVVKVKADVRGYVASWDRMTESVANTKSRSFAPFGGKGWAYAATADMYLWSAAGKLLWKERRGFALLGVKSGVSSNFRERPLTDVYPNSGLMERWLDGTFSQLALGRPAGPLPVSPEIQEQLEKARQAGKGQK